MTEVTLTTPRQVEVTNFNVTTTIEVTKATFRNVLFSTEGRIVARMFNFPENRIVLWENAEGLIKQAEGLNNALIISRLIEVLG